MSAGGEEHHQAARTAAPPVCFNAPEPDVSVSKAGGEQEFTYHRPVVAGDRLTSASEVVDYYAKESGERTMTFRVTETTYRGEAGELVLTARMNLIHRS